MILMAIIVGAHGIQGAVKVKTFSQDPVHILAYGPLQDEKGHAIVAKLVRVVSPTSVIMKIEGVQDRNQAEVLRGTKLYVMRDQLPNLCEEEFYHTDLIGLPVIDLEGQETGVIQAVHNFGAGDFLEIVDSDHHVYTISFTRQAVPQVSIRKPGGKPGACVVIDRQYLLDSRVTSTEQDKS